MSALLMGIFPPWWVKPPNLSLIHIYVEAQVAMMIANQAADNDNQVSIQQVRQQLEEEYPLAAVPFDDYVETVSYTHLDVYKRQALS